MGASHNPNPTIRRAVIRPAVASPQASASIDAPQKSAGRRTRDALGEFRQYVDWLEKKWLSDDPAPNLSELEATPIQHTDDVVQERWDGPTSQSQAVPVPMAHTTFTPESQSAPIVPSSKPIVELPSQRDQLIAKISAAIAATLQGGESEDWEQQAHTYLQERGVTSPVTLSSGPATEWSPALSQDDEEILVGELLRQRTESQLAPPPSRAPNPTPQTVAAATTQDDCPIPLDVAAWDVEDFRWPVVTNQLIVSAGQVLQELLQASSGSATNGAQRMAITSAQRTQGATSVAISLARWAAAQGHRTLLIDADVACPSLSSRVGMDSSLSWLNGINRDLPIAELIIRSRRSNLCVMPLASKVSRVIWPRFIFDCLGELLDPVASQFDLILIDAGSASQLLDELSQPGHLLDGLLLINDGDPKSLSTIQRRLLTFGIQHLVLVENRQHSAVPQVA